MRARRLLHFHYADDVFRIARPKAERLRRQAFCELVEIVYLTPVVPEHILENGRGDGWLRHGYFLLLTGKRLPVYGAANEQSHRLGRCQAFLSGA
jgi:hypothetical protein